MRIENNYLKHERGHQGLRTAETGTCFTQKNKYSINITYAEREQARPQVKIKIEGLKIVKVGRPKRVVPLRRRRGIHTELQA